MDAREILIANTRTQKNSKITTDATTLGELKAALDAENIDYSDMTFTEGISKTQLLDDATQLPQNVMFKGKQTNNLVILLTNTKKKVASGAMSRNEAYQAIKDNNLQEAVKKYFGRNFTQVATANLITFLEEQTADTKPETLPDEELAESEVEPEEEENTYTYAIMDAIVDAENKSIENSLYNHILWLVQSKVFNKEDVEQLIEDLGYVLKCMDASKKTKAAPKTPVTTSDGSITEDDINDMLDDLGI